MPISAKLLEKRDRNEKENPKRSDFLSALNYIITEDISFNGHRLNDQKKERFYNGLLLLITAGVDIKSSLEIITEEQKKGPDKELFSNISKQVVHGMNLSEALEKSGKFSAYECYSIRIGEETGRMREVLEQMSVYYTRKIQQRRKITGALSYPILVLITSFGAIFFLLNFLVPMFSDIFSRMHGELPAITRMVISFSQGFGKTIPWIGLLILAAIVFVMANRKKLWYRQMAGNLLLKIPGLGKLVLQVYLLRFFHSMALLTSAQVPLLKAIDLVKKMIGFYPLETVMVDIHAGIMQGKPLWKCMESTGLFEKKILHIIKVAEEVNKLHVIFNRLNTQYSEELDYRIQVFTNLLEPLLIVFVGGLVGIILISMYLPLFQIGNTLM